MFQDVSVYCYLLFCLQMLLCWLQWTCYEKSLEFWSETGLRSNYLPLGHSDSKLLRSHSSEWSTLQYKEFDSSTSKSLPAGEKGLEMRQNPPQIAPDCEKQPLFTCKDSPRETEAARDRKEQSWDGRFAAISCVKNVKSNLQPSTTCELSVHR